MFLPDNAPIRNTDQVSQVIGCTKREGTNMGGKNDKYEYRHKGQVTIWTVKYKNSEVSKIGSVQQTVTYITAPIGCDVNEDNFLIESNFVVMKYINRT